MIASGNWKSEKEFPPSSSIFLLIADTIGSVGTRKGNLVIITLLRFSPCTSTPSQKEVVPIALDFLLP